MATSPQFDQASRKAAPDWERIELDYRAGIKTLRQIAGEHELSEGAIRKRAKRDDWTRDLSERIQSKADALVRTEAVRSEVRTERAASERAIVEANAEAVASVRLAHRKDIHRARSLTNALLDELEGQTDPQTLQALQELGDVMRDPDASRDRLNEIYQAVITLPERSKTMKVLAESLQKLVDMERTAFGMDAKVIEQDQAGKLRGMTDAERAVRLANVLKAGAGAGAGLLAALGKKGD